jgi:hypothetical protein
MRLSEMNTRLRARTKVSMARVPLTRHTQAAWWPRAVKKAGKTRRLVLLLYAPYRTVFLLDRGSVIRDSELSLRPIWPRL